MQRLSNRLIFVALATMLVAGCSDQESATDLNPEGPPMVRQVRLLETFTNGTIDDQRRLFAFGTHELAPRGARKPVQRDGDAAADLDIGRTRATPCVVIIDER